MNAGKSVRLFLVDGTPGGLLTAEIVNWTGHVMAAPRSDLAALLKREEVTRTGIYLLLGDDPDSPGRQKVYIGEGDDISKRLRKHNSEKEFWDRAVVLTSKDMNLTKAHARYLEARFITLSAQANRATLDNSTNPEPINLPEADRSDMESFIEQAKIILPVLGINLLRATKPLPATGNAAPKGDTSPIFRITTRGVDATAQEVDGEFVVREGSLAYRSWDGAGVSYEKLRRQLDADGTLLPTADDKHMRFTRDYVFNSPSAAGAVVLGRNSNGRLEWKVEGTKQTYAQWQESLLSAGLGQTVTPSQASTDGDTA